MFKTFIAGLTALSLTVTPVAATAQSNDGGFQHEDFATAIFALVVMGVIGKALTNNSRDSHQAEAPVRTHRAAPDRHPRRINPDRGGLRDDRRPWWEDRNDRPVVTHNRAVPNRCLYDVRTRHGTQRMYGRNCLRNHYPAFHRLPDRCEVRIAARNGIRRGFDPSCLRAAGLTHRGNR